MRAQNHGLTLRILCVVVAATALGTGVATAASALSPSAYRAQLNSLCRSNTPRLHALETDLTRAIKAQEGLTAGADLGELLLIGLRQNARIEATPVPASLTTQMAPIIRLLRQIDAHARLGIAKAAKSDSRGLIAEIDTIGRLAKPLNKQLDRAGLRDCGSNQ